MRLLPRGRPLLVAEAGVNHNGRPDLALRLVDAAARAGADAVKFQTFRAAALAAASAPRAAYQRRGARGGSSQLELLRRLELPRPAYRALVRRCRERGLLFLSTAFDEESADFLERLGMKAFKIPSGEITNLPLLAHIGRKGRPIILSTGMSRMSEVAEAVSALRGAGARDLVLLHCVSSYPAPPREANLRAMDSLRRAFKVPVGFSDHTPGIEVALAAAALGAAVIEKHFTLDKSLPGPDHSMSLAPRELAALARGLRAVAASLGDGRKAPRACEADVRRAARRSVVLARGLPAGARLAAADLALKRPGTGLAPGRLRSLVGRRLRRALPADTLLARDMLR